MLLSEKRADLMEEGFWPVEDREPAAGKSFPSVEPAVGAGVDSLLPGSADLGGRPQWEEGRGPVSQAAAASGSWTRAPASPPALPQGRED